MLCLPLLNLSSRETNRLPVAEINKQLGCGGVYGGNYLPLELQVLPQFSGGEFVVDYGDDYYGELPPNHNHQSLARRKATFLLVKVDGYREQVIDEGEVEDRLKVHGINTPGAHPHSHFIAKGKTLGRFSFYCVWPGFSRTPSTPPVRQGVVGSDLRQFLEGFAAGRR